MNAANLAQNAYSQAHKNTGTPRTVEYQLLAKVTAELSSLNKLDMDYFPRLTEALHRNRMFWDTVAADVASEGNTLPLDLRAQIFSLAEFSRGHSQKILRGETDPSALIEVNTAVMRGLRRSTETS